MEILLKVLSHFAPAVESSSMFLNGYKSKRSALHDLNPADPVS